MKRLLLVMPALAGAAVAPARAEDQSPKELVSEIYRTPALDDKQLRGHFTQSLLAAAAEMNRRAKALDATGLSFDPLAHAQPPDMRDLSIAVESAAPEKTVVAARFDSGANARHVVRYVYVREGGVWRLDDISGESGLDKWDLRALIDSKAGQ